MCSIPELKDAWVPKALPYYAVHGYSNTDNRGPLGYFQQRPSRAWGTAEQILDPNHTLGAFCQEAATQRREVDETDPAQLGEWIADVQQRSREDLSGEYAKHYETAIHLIAAGRALLPEEYRYDDSDSRFSSEPGRTVVDNACRRPPTRSTELKLASESLAGSRAKVPCSRGWAPPSQLWPLASDSATAGARVFGRRSARLCPVRRHADFAGGDETEPGTALVR